jgi:hypothetical protein
MKRIGLVCALLLWGALSGTGAADDETRLKGRFDWNGHASGDLEAVFTPTGDGTWDVAFHFTHSDTPHVYSGTAEGSLSAGALRGKVFNEDRKRSFTFEGEFKEGRFAGTHAETTGGGVKDTGSLTLG